MVAAQHEANLYALRLSAAYRGLNATAVPNLPAVCLGETELTLHCGFVDDDATRKTFEIDETAVRSSIRKAAPRIAEAIVSGVLNTAVRNTAVAENDEEPVARLHREAELKRDFIAFIGNKIDGALTKYRPELIGTNGRFDWQRLQAIILQVIDEQVLNHQDLAYLFETGSEAGLGADVLENLKADLKTKLPHLLKDTAVGHSETHDTIEVVADTEALAKLPATCIQTLRLKILPQHLFVETAPL